MTYEKMFEECVETARRRIRSIADESSRVSFVISPCPSYFDCHDDTCFGIYATDSSGSEYECVFIGSEWDCYKAFVELFPYESVIRSADYRLIY